MKKTVRVPLIVAAALPLPAGGCISCAFLSTHRVSERVQVLGSAAVDTGFACSDHNPVAMRFLLREQPEPTPEDRPAACGRFALSPVPAGMGMGDCHEF